VFVLLPGLALFLAMAAGGRAMAWLAIPASVVTMTGLILLIQNAYDLWQTWAYAWALIYPTAVGLGLWLEGAWRHQPRPEERGRTLAALGAVLFLAGAAFFEGVLNLSGLAEATAVHNVGAAALIVLGGALLLFRNPHPSASR
jgi:peptidoglycan/LPS O-acetylase OafA/YrhL